MTDPYTGKAQDKRYTSDDVDVTFNLKRCIHAKECIRGLSAVFDTDKRPWIQPGNATADDVAQVVVRCPSGALHYDRKDGGGEEATPDRNVIRIWHNGPLQVHGDLTINGAHVAIEDETRVTLCRCGVSKNKPFCDNSHKDANFEGETVPPVQGKGTPQTEGGKLTITATENGPLALTGKLEIRDEADNILFSGEQTYLCRCGQSSKKPFCDGTHQQVNFEAD